MKIHNFKYLLFASLAFASCSEEIEEEVAAPVVVSAGTADFSRYVALGNSITAGFSDGALFKAGQANSFAKLLADQFATVGGGVFKIPYMNDNVGGLLLLGNVIAGPRLVFNGTGPVPLTGTPTTEIGVPLAGPFNNFGIPGAKVGHLLAPNYGDVAGLLTNPRTANPYFVRFRSSATASVIGDAMVQNPTFFTLWIGNNDVLGYATTGGDGSDPITPTANFQGYYESLVNSLTSGAAKAKGVVANIPNVTALPHFTTVPYNALDASTNATYAAQIPTLNQTYAGLNQAFVALGFPERQIVFNTTGRSAVVIHDESITNISAQLTAALTAGGFPAAQAALFGSQFGQCRQAKIHSSTSRDLLVLPSSSVIGQVNMTRLAQLMGAGLTQAQAGQLSVNGITFPLEDKWVLLASEQAEIKTATDSFNAIIKNTATAKGLAFVDAAAIMQQASTTGIRFGTFSMNSSLVTGGVFGLDGVHLTARANAYAANKFLEAIETTYGAKFNKYGPDQFSISYPASLGN